MPLRTDHSLWHSLPGVVAAYQPIACPGGALLARHNVAGGQPSARYMATPGTAPAFSPLTGWTLALTSKLETGVLPENNQQWSLAARFVRSAGGSGYGALLGNVAANGSPGIGLYSSSGQTYLAWAANSPTGPERVLFSSTPTSGVVVISGRNAFLNGVYVGAASIGSGSAWTQTVTIGVCGDMKAFVGTLQCALIGSTPWSASQAYDLSRQMAYCHANPEWSAWGRRRRYYYAPSAAAMAAFSPVGSGVIGSSVVRSVQ